jgi:Dolichyl-phosphate-mannose-protein mannosyltransferase
MVSSEVSERRSPPGPAVLLAGLVVLAALLRFYKLGQWGFEGDEIFTLRDSLHPLFVNPRPLLYILNYFVIRPITPLDEFGLRLLPAVAGVLAVPVLYYTTRRLAGTRAALFAALLLTTSGLLVYHSQYARYWSVVFLFSAVYPYALYLGIHERDRRWLAVGAAATVLAVLAHPVSALLLGGMGIWLAATYLRRDLLVDLWRQPGVRWVAIGVTVAAAAIAMRYFPILRNWIEIHDVGQGSDHLLSLPGRPGVKQIAYLASYVDGLTLPVVLIGALGIGLLWRDRERGRSLALLMACVFLFPIIFLVLLSLRTAVSTTYLLPTAPVMFIGAGVLLDRLAAMDLGLRPRWLVAAVVAVVIIDAGLPTLLSQYRDGRRPDFRGAARWLGERVTPGDVVYSDQAVVLTHYLPGVPVDRLTADPDALTSTMATLDEPTRGEELWIVIPASAQGGLKSTAQIGGMTAWIYDHCQLRTTLGKTRLDFRQTQLQIYRCAPSASPE